MHNCNLFDFTMIVISFAASILLPYGRLSAGDELYDFFTIANFNFTFFGRNETTIFVSKLTNAKMFYTHNNSFCCRSNIMEF